MGGLKPPHPLPLRGPWKVESDSPGLVDFAVGRVNSVLKVARYSFSGSIPPKCEHKLNRHKKRFGKIATTVVSGKDENLL